MEGGVEGYYLGNGRKDMADRTDSEEVGRVMERGELGAVLDFSEHIVVHYCT